MTDAPLPPELVDELLSADLDGEFDAAARDAGLDPAAARAQLDAIPDIADRRAALVQAQAALAVPPLSDAVRERLVRVAADAVPRDELTERRHRRRSIVTVAGSIAAALLVVVGAVAVINAGQDDNDGATVASESADAGIAASPTTGAAFAPGATGYYATQDFGEIADADALHSVVEQRLVQLTAAADEDAAAPEAAGGDSARNSAGNPTAGVAPNDSYAFDSSAQACVEKVVRDVMNGESPTLVGTATFAGTPAFVLVFDDASGEGHVTLVAAVDDCRLLASDQ